MPGSMPEDQHTQQATKSPTENARQEQRFFRNAPTAAYGFDFVNEVKQGYCQIKDDVVEQNGRFCDDIQKWLHGTENSL